MREYSECNALEKLLYINDYDVDSVNSCLVIAPNYYSQFRRVGNAVVDYFNLPHKEDELCIPDCDSEYMEKIIDDIAYCVNGREYDAVICFTTEDIENEYCLCSKIHDNLEIKKYEINYFADEYTFYAHHYLPDYNRIERMLTRCDVNLNKIKSCLLLAPSSFNDIKKIGNAEVEYYNIPDAAEMLEYGYNETMFRLVQAVNNVYRRKFDAVVVVLTDEMDNKFNLQYDVHECVKGKKYEAYWYVDSREVSVIDHSKSDWPEIHGS